MSDLIMFYGTECIHCHEMMPLLEQLEDDVNVKVDQLEVWHDSKNKALYDKCNTGVKCTGVPYFYNKKSKKFICGSTSYDKLKEWAAGK